MKNGIILIGIAFAVALAAVVGNRLSNDALAVVVGAVCGISASIPVTIGLVIAASRNWGREENVREIGYDYGSNRYVPQPPMVIFAPPQQPPFPYGLPPSQYVAPMNAPALGAPREFKIIGGE
jgi:hypothetical protein